jgi:hypothetical protein
MNLSHSYQRRTSTIIKVIGLITLLAIPLVLLSLQLAGNSRAESTSSEAKAVTQVSGPLASAPIDQSYQLPLRNRDGEEVAQITFEIQSAEKRQDILVKGNLATAINDRLFLIINVKINNPYTQAIEIPVRSYFRLSTNGNQSEWLAPDIHNDPVEIQAISTKLTRIGFPINKSDQNLVIQFGEVKGDKQLIELNFE